MTTDTRDALLELLMGWRLSHTTDDDSSGYPMVDALSSPGADAIATGKSEIELLADEISYRFLRTPRPEDARDAVVTAAWALDALMPTGDGLRYFHAGFEVKQLRAALAALTQPEAK